MTRILSIVALLSVLSAPAFAQDAPSGGPAIVDYRWSVYMACTLVFLAIIVYLVSAHRRMTRAAEDLSHVERRVQALEGRS